MRQTDDPNPAHEEEARHVCGETPAADVSLWGGRGFIISQPARIGMLCIVVTLHHREKARDHTAPIVRVVRGLLQTGIVWVVRGLLQTGIIRVVRS